LRFIVPLPSSTTEETIYPKNQILKQSCPIINFNILIQYLKKILKI
jgi:hypothetical protein